MLVVSRKVGESVMIGDDVEVTVTYSEKGAAKLAIEAPRSVAIFRKEIYVREKAAGRPLLSPDQREHKG